MGLNLKKINLLVMPTDICNMNCIYCFHSAHHEKRGKMSVETLKKLYDITCSEYSEVTIIWHGGEPLVMGLDFYNKAIEMQKDYKVIIRNRMPLEDKLWSIGILDQVYLEIICLV